MTLEDEGLKQRPKEEAPEEIGLGNIARQIETPTTNPQVVKEHIARGRID